MKNFTICVFMLVLGVLAASCSVHQNPSESGKDLSVNEARQRSARLDRVRYELSFELDGTAPEFTGEARVLFELKDDRSDLRLDFTGGTVLALKVNDMDVSAEAYNRSFILLPGSALRNGQNTVEVTFKHPYSTTGAGLYRFQDPQDGNVYVYTDFEPFDANRLFPCFDQPDLKAAYTVRVQAPEDWLVVTSNREETVTLPSHGRRVWLFPPSKKFSTYVFSLIAGPYHVWQDQTGLRRTGEVTAVQAGRIPLRLLARQSVAKYVNADEWFQITRQGFEFFESWFAYAYPFEKYDQILVPDFNAGAMENVAAVTFNDDHYVFRGVPTQTQKERQANVILHEMAHMWFGNLVTMKWWDDLWLNESFASYMAAKALDEATEFKQAWQSFFSGMKNWAYWEDELVTTHPVAVPVDGTDQAFANFDGITYGKGAAVLKQLAYLLGEEKFREGVRAYFERHAYGNAVLDDFMASLAGAAGVDLSVWTGNWLKTAGLNTLQVNYECQENRVTSFALLQKSDQEQISPRQHRTQIGLFYQMDSGLELNNVFSADYEGQDTQLAQAIGQPCPDFVYPNLGDWDYVKVKPDAKSFAAAQNQLKQFQDNLLRAMLWQNFWEALRDGLMPPRDYLALVLNNLPTESDFRIAEKVAHTVYGNLDHSPSLLLYLMRQGTEGSEQIGSVHAKLEDLFWGLFETAEGESDFKKLWFDSFVRVAGSETARQRLLALSAADFKITGLTLDQDRRWNVIKQLSLLGAPETNDLRQMELKRDPSHAGEKMALAVEVIRPDQRNKQKWFDEVVKPDSTMTLAELKSVMESLYPVRQMGLRPQYAQAFYENLVKLAPQKESEFLERFTANMVPTSCSPESLAQLDQFLKLHDQLPAVVLKELKVARQEDERCVRIRGVSSY